ncbi:MAG TPA: polysaccharide biosynthesis/export family protein [Pseudolabrys sp.]|nr:polysaccharide biosynthesis/export family protein [Pseudolabrys sp.]
MRDRMSILRLVAFMVLAVLLPACASNTGQTPTAAAAATDGGQAAAAATPTSSPVYAVTDPTEQPQPTKAADTTAALASTSGQTGDYRIGPRDVLDISVFQVNDLNKSVQVNEDGSITLPLIGKVLVGGKTTSQAEEMIADLLRKRYMQSPQVSVALKQYGQRVTVNGEVKGPRVLSVDGKVTLSEAIASAGGLGELADSKRVHVARRVGNRVQDDIYDLNAIQSGQTADPTLKGGDIVVVEQSGTQVVFKNMKDLLPFAILANLI